MSPTRQRHHHVSRVIATITVAMLLGAIGCSSRVPIVQRDDAAITKDVRERLAADPQAGSLDIIVGTTSGVVQLTGSVPTSSDRDSVERIALDTQGVQSVDNQVRFGIGPAPARE